MVSNTRHAMSLGRCFEKEEENLDSLMDQCDKQFEKAENYASDYGSVPSTKRTIKNYVKGKIVSNGSKTSMMNHFSKHQPHASYSTQDHPPSESAQGMLSPHGSDSTGTKTDSEDS